MSNSDRAFEIAIGETIYTVDYDIDHDGSVDINAAVADDGTPITADVRRMLANKIRDWADEDWRLDRAEAAAWRRTNSFSGREP